MNTFTFYFILIVTLTHGVATLALSLVPLSGIECPENALIDPCTCYQDGLFCSGDRVTQLIIDRAFAVVRDVNGLSPDDQLNLRTVGLQYLPLTHLDLTPFFNLNVSQLTISYNRQLTSMSGHPSQEGSILVTDKLEFLLNELTNEGMGDALKMFDPSLPYLDLSFNNLIGQSKPSNSKGNGREDFEFLPGLSRFTKLQTLDLMYNPLDTLGSTRGQLSLNEELTYLNFQMSDLKNIGENAFAFNGDSSGSNSTMTPLVINLSYNRLDDSSINISQSGLLNLKRPLELNLEFGRFNFISAGNFESLLKREEPTVIQFGFNDLVCDERMKWLHDGKNIYESRVINANCTNDPGFDVFHTNLIL